MHPRRALIYTRHRQEKLVRYNSCVSQLRNLLTWWASLPDVEKASRQNSTALVTNCEKIIQGEREAWLSSASSKSASRPDARGNAATKPQDETTTPHQSVGGPPKVL